MQRVPKTHQRSWTATEVNYRRWITGSMPVLLRSLLVKPHMAFRFWHVQIMGDVVMIALGLRTSELLPIGIIIPSYVHIMNGRVFERVQTICTKCYGSTAGHSSTNVCGRGTASRVRSSWNWNALTKSLDSAVPVAVREIGRWQSRALLFLCVDIYLIMAGRCPFLFFYWTPHDMLGGVCVSWEKRNRTLN